MTETYNREEEDVADLQEGARLSYLAGTGMYLLSIYLAASADIDLIHTTSASGAPVKDAAKLGAAVAVAWFGRQWRDDAIWTWSVAEELAESTGQQG